MKYRYNIILFLFFCSFAAFALPKDDFAHTLELAKYSSCKDVVEYTQNSITPTVIDPALPDQSKLKALSTGPFPWRFEVTNGYQEGFVYYALFGYASEQNGDIPFAYRCYQNSLACIDEEKSFFNPLPQAEIYLAIGRTCLAAGRYMDAKDWLDNAFLESGDNKPLQAAIDRVLIQRANEIGDYPEIIFLYQHLEEVSRASQRGLRATGHGSRVTGLTKDEIANYAQILFWSRKDREGFSKLLEGISKNGIDNNLGVKDPIVDKFLNNIMRADNDEVKWFYDLLGWAIVDARAKAGDENYLAFLCNARTLFCKVYDFLDKEDDLKKVKERIDDVKRQLAEGYDVFGKESRPAIRDPRSVKKKRKSKTVVFNEFGEIKTTLEIDLDDLLMTADCKMKVKDYNGAKKFYESALKIATGSFANLEYDGTTMENAAIIGLIQTKNKIQKTKNKFVFDNSYRAAELTLQLYCQATNDEQRAKWDTDTAITILPQANLTLLKFIRKEIYKCVKKLEFDKAIKLSNEYYLYDWLSWIYAAQFKPEESFLAMIDNVRYDNDYINRSYKLQIASAHWSWASDDDLLKYEKLLSTSLISPILNCKNKRASGNLMFDYEFATSWREIYGVYEFELRQEIYKQNYNIALALITNYFSKSESECHNSTISYNVSHQFYNNSTNEFKGTMQAGHELKKSQLLLKLSFTNGAYKAAINAYERRCHSFRNFNANIIYPTLETKIIEDCLVSFRKAKILTHINWLERKKEKCRKLNAKSYVNIIEDKIMYFNNKLKKK